MTLVPKAQTISITELGSLGASSTTSMDDYGFEARPQHLLQWNALNPMAFKSLKTIEAEVVRMTAEMLHGGDDAVGTMTSGGTESILMAMKAP